MLLRAPALRRLGLIALVATLGCKPDPAPTKSPEPAPEPAPDPGGPTAETEVDAPGAGETEDEPEEAEVGETDDADELDAPAETDDADDERDEAEAGGEPAVAANEPDKAKQAKQAKQKDKKKKRPPLPRPAHALKGPTCQKSFAVGNKVKGFRLPSVDGKKTISPGGYRNRVMLLNFWGTWCKPCLKELPEFDRLYRKYRKNGLTLVAVATDEEPEPVQAFIDKHKLRAKVALEGEAVAGAYNRPNFPFTFVVDGRGKIVAAYEYIDNNCMGDLEQVIRDELEKLDR